ncbi:MAG: hypothetical protein ABIZ04_18460 [Opitutus sp.]
MTTEFVFFADLVLLLRLRLLLSDEAVSWRSWLIKGLIEVLALSLFEPHPFLIGAGLTIVALNLTAGYWDRRTHDRNGGRLLFGVLHLVVLSIWFSKAAGMRFRPEIIACGDWIESWSALGMELRRVLSARGLKTLLGFLLAANEANLLVRWLLGRLQIKPGANFTLVNAGIDAGEYNRGRVIGLLERTLIYAFVLGGQFGAIGFTLAAKGFTRFKELENRGFAEYVLIGTLLSSSIAMAAGAWIKLSG